MGYTYYIKNFSNHSIRLYFDSAPNHTVLNKLKKDGWIWIPELLCWLADLSKHSEEFAKSIGAIDGTPANSNPAISPTDMDLEKIRKSMVAIFKNPIFESYSLHQITEYLDSLSSGTPMFVKVDQIGLADAAGCAVILTNPAHLKFEKLCIVQNRETANEYRSVFHIDSPFAQHIMRSIAFRRPYVLYKSEIFGIIGVSDTTFTRNIISHTRNLNLPNAYADVWVYRLKMPCKHHNVQSVTAYVASDRSSVEQPINVAYCPVCQRYYINADQYRSFTHAYGLPYIRLRTDAVPDYRSWQEESLLHHMGYNVNATDDLTPDQRHAILEHAIDTGAMSKIDVVSFLEFLIHNAEYNPRFVNAINKWRADVEHIRNYHLQEQRYVRGRLLFRK